MYYTSLPLSPCQPQFLVHSHNLRTITFHPTILTTAHNYPQSPHNSHKSHNPDKSLQISSNAHLLVSAWLTLIPCSSKIAKYSEREMEPLPSLSTWNTEKLVRNIIASFSLLHPPSLKKMVKISKSSSDIAVEIFFLIIETHLDLLCGEWFLQSFLEGKLEFCKNREDSELCIK